MKTNASPSTTLAVIVLLPFLLAGAQATAETGKPSTPDALADSEGDGTPDASDPNPFIAEVAGISWRIGQMSVGWKFNASIEELKTTLTEHETQVLHQNELSFGAKGETSAELSAQAKAKFSFNPLKLFGLTDSGAEANFQTRFAASGDVTWSKSDRERASDLTRLLSQTQIAHKLSDLNLEFTVLFFNFGDDDFIGENLQIPIKTGENVSAIAQPLGANGPESRIRIPAHRDRSIPIRFRASLDTTQSLALLRAMELGSLSISIEESQGAITSMKDGNTVDAISALTQMRRKCCKLTVEVEGKEFQWSVARRNAKTLEPLHLSDAFAALNALAARDGGPTAKLFEYTDRYLRSAAGRDCSLYPVRWWVSALARGSAPEMDMDVNPSVELPNAFWLRERKGFPGDMKRWVLLGKNGDAWAPSVAGELLSKGYGGVEKDKKRASEFWQEAANLGDTRAMTELGYAYFTGGAGLSKDAEKAAELWTQAAKLGHANALTCLGDAHYSLAWTENKDLAIANAVALWQRAADLGDTEALVRLGIVHLKGLGGFPADERKALEFWQNAADLGNSQALTQLGSAYFNGMANLPKDDKKAAELWQEAANSGETEALIKLGLAYLNGQAGRAKDEKKAAELWQQAADLGSARALTRLGMAHLHGHCGFAEDEKKGVSLWQQAADAGDLEAMSLLADGYANGKYGLPRDPDRAAELERKAGKNGEQ